MVDIDGVHINPAHVVSAEVEQRFYMNGSTAFLVVHLVDGRTIRREHGYGFDAFATLKRIREGNGNG